MCRSDSPAGIYLRKPPVRKRLVWWLWLIKWGTDSFGGSIDFDTDETGTRVQITLPGDLVEEMK